MTTIREPNALSLETMKRNHEKQLCVYAALALCFKELSLQSLIVTAVVAESAKKIITNNTKHLPASQVWLCCLLATKEQNLRNAGIDSWISEVDCNLHVPGAAEKS